MQSRKLFTGCSYIAQSRSLSSRVCAHVCIYNMYICTYRYYACMYVHRYVGRCVHMHACMHVCNCLRMYARECLYVYVHRYVDILAFMPFCLFMLYSVISYSVLVCYVVLLCIVVHKCCSPFWDYCIVLYCIAIVDLIPGCLLKQFLWCYTMWEQF